MLHLATRNDYQRMAALLILRGVDLDEVWFFLFMCTYLVTSSLCS